MDITTIVLLVVAFVIGAAIAWIFKKGDKSAARLAEVEAEKNALEQRLTEETASSAKKLAEEAEASAKKITDIKTKYDNLLGEVKAQCSKLDSQLKAALDGKIEESVKEQLEEAKKMRKKIKDLEEEIEENEDDIDDLKKKIRTKDADMSELQDNLSKEQKLSKQFKEELSETKRQLDDTIEELNLKMGTLEFIQEILSAKEFSNEDSRKLNKNVDTFENFIKGQYIDLLSFISKTTPELPWKDGKLKDCFEKEKKEIYIAFDQWASTKRKRWLDGKTTIAFVGEFSAGKTSIVNRILSQDDPSVPKLPVSTKATTAIPTYIAGALDVHYTFVAGDGKWNLIEENIFKMVSKEILDQVNGISSLIKYFVMTYKNPNLDGLSILDTPGFNSNDSEDRDRTIEVINECDALFWVFDVNAGTVNRSSISIIKEKLNKPLYVIINKVDTKSSSEVKKVEELIKKTLADEGLSVQKFIRFSAKASLQDIMKPIKEVDKTAVRDTFIKDIGEDIEMLSSMFKNKVNSCNADYHETTQQADYLTNNVIKALNALVSDAETAASIPQWTEHMFSKDRFEMSQQEGNRLQNILDRMATTRIRTIAENFDSRVEKAGEIQQAWSELCDLKAAWQKIEDCNKQYKKITKELETYDNRNKFFAIS